MQGLLFMPCCFGDAGALLVINPMTAKSCVVNKFMYPSTIKHTSTRYGCFCELFFSISLCDLFRTCGTIKICFGWI